MHKHSIWFDCAELVSAHTLATQRLHFIDSASSGACADVQAIPSYTRASVSDEIIRVQDHIRAIIDFSRWQRLGKRLGIAKRLPWERGEWWTQLSLEADASGSGPAGPTNRAAMSELLAELERLRGLRNELANSRWRKLGQRLGLARPLPWESPPRRGSLEEGFSPKSKTASRSATESRAVHRPRATRSS